MKKNKTIIALLLITIVGVTGLTIAYFLNSQSIENEFFTKKFGTLVEEKFVSPDNWLPGNTTPKKVVATNKGNIDQAVRISLTEEWKPYNSNATLTGWITEDGYKSSHLEQNEPSNDERVAIVNFANSSDWTKVGDYYYYNYKLAPNESTSSLIKSVTFNPKTKLDDTCQTTIEAGKKTISCLSSGSDYDHATYKLTFTIETVQYNKYNEAWNLNNTVTIAPERPLSAAQYLASNATNPAGAEYNADTKGNMFQFSHTVNGNTVNEIRYIGDTPNNYVKFNCDDDGTNCEIWRILGIFDVDDGTGNVEQRMKLVRGNAFATTMYWNSGSKNNDWTDTNASLKNFLNGDYYNASGDAATYGLKVSARDLIDDAVYYLGAGNSYGTAEEVYTWERGNTTCGVCNSDTTKLTWTGKVALMYPSDGYLVYGNGVNATCYGNTNGCSESNAQTGWVYNSNILEGQLSPNSIWFLSPYFEVTNGVFIVNADGSLKRYGGVHYDDELNNLRGVRPVVYLKSRVKIAGGTGEVGNPYTLLSY